MSLWLAFVVAFALFPAYNANAELADGKYSLPYQVNKAGSTSASIANDYFVKPATLVKKDGVMYVQLTLNKSTQFVKFEAPTGGNKVVATDEANDRRTVQFNVADLSKALTVNIRLEIPEEDYYHNYKIDFVWFADKSKLIEAYAAPVKEVAKTTETKQEVKQETKATEPTKSAEKPAATETKKDEKVATTETKKEEAKTEEAKTEEPQQEQVKTEEAVTETKEASKKEESKATEQEPATENKKDEETIAVASAQINDQATTNEAAEENTESGNSNLIMWIIIALAAVFAVTGGYGYYKKLGTKK